jgi:hypothetical protein
LIEHTPDRTWKSTESGFRWVVSDAALAGNRVFYDPGAKALDVGAQGGPQIVGKGLKFRTLILGGNELLTQVAYAVFEAALHIRNLPGISSWKNTGRA